MPTSFTYAGLERRVDRLTIPRCETCGSSRTAVIGRTDYWLYCRCPDCAFRVEYLQTGGRTMRVVTHCGTIWTLHRNGQTALAEIVNIEGIGLELRYTRNRKSFVGGPSRTVQNC